MKRTFTDVWLTAWLIMTSAWCGAQEAHYLINSGKEGDQPRVTQLHLRLTGYEVVNGRPYAWWELSARQRDGALFGVRLLSERPPMTTPDGIGDVERYLYRDAGGKVFDYRDAASGRALLPENRFREDFLPVPAADAAYVNGFATAGAYMGHALVLMEPFDPVPALSFDGARVLNLRHDFLMGGQISVWTERNTDGNDWINRPYTQAELETLIDAGINYYGDVGELQPWLKEQPVFFHSTPSLPDTFYRSNATTLSYMDEPSIRFGWDDNVPGYNVQAPEQHANAVRQRVRSFQSPRERRLHVGHDVGALDLYNVPPLAWETHYYSAYAQMMGGASGIVYEGRYRLRGFGWSPDAFLGFEGLEQLSFDDQLNYFNAFMRGAARVFGGDWGISLYPEGDAWLYPHAVRHAYDNGARFCWFWLHPPEISYYTMIEIGRLMQEHIAAQPRGELRQANRRATHAVVLPPGYALTPDGAVWGGGREQLSRGGALYGDIAAAAFHEALLLSRRGIPYDIINDAPDVTAHGYERLIRVGEDASLNAEPPLEGSRAANGLTLRLTDDVAADVIDRASEVVEYVVPRVEAVRIDGELDDWPADRWLTLSSEGQGHTDLIDLELTVTTVASATLWDELKHTYLGFDYKQLTEELKPLYHLQDLQIVTGDAVDESRPGINLEKPAIVVTAVRPGSPAEKGGLRVGDVIRRMGDKVIRWEFEVYTVLYQLRERDGHELRFKITRNDRARLGAKDDLAGDVALAVDEHNLYMAARITDNVHAQPFNGWYLWQGDSVQLGLDAILDRSEGYGEYGHEIALALRDNGQALVWRYHGQRNQPRHEIAGARVRIVREGTTTRYEAAVPLTELPSLQPDLWPRAGFNVVVNDNDGGEATQRKGRLELRPGAMTRGKQLRLFPQLEFEPSPYRDKVSAALFWRRRATPEGGHFRAVLAAGSPHSTTAYIQATLQSLDRPETAAVTAAAEVPLASRAREWSLEAHTASPPGRYALTIVARDDQGTPVQQDTMPVFVYPTSPPDKDWRAAANRRIEALRKRNARIRFVDANNQPLAGYVVSARQTRPHFPFGCTINRHAFQTPEYAAFFRKHFNWAVLENDAKWYANEKNPGEVTYETADKILEFCEANGIKVRGHCLFWELEHYVQPWVRALDDTALRKAVERRAESAVTHFKDRFVHWDVNNEMLHGDFFARRLGPDIHIWMFRRTRELDPKVRLFVNDHSVVSGDRTDHYIHHIQDLRARGAEVQGIGVQCHFGDAVDPILTLQRLDKLAQLNLPIWVTEYDCVHPDPEQRAAALENLYRAAYSHPSVQGILMWGFWAKSHWRGPDAALVDEDWTVNAAGRRYLALLEEWSTQTEGETDADGVFAFRGFHGDYELSVRAPSGDVFSATLSMPPGPGPLLATITR